MKKSLATILGTFMALNMSVTGCSASGSDAWKNNAGKIDLNTMAVVGNGISVSDNVINITSGGDFDVTGTLENGMIYVDTEEKVKLRLSGASITNSNGPAIYFNNTEKGFITITENTENYLTDGKEYTDEEADAALFSNDDLEIKGDGTLTITGNYKHGIAGDDDVKIENGTININSYEHGIKVNDTLSVLGGNITVNAETGKGIKAELELIIDNGILNITSQQDEGIESKGTLTVNGGTINVTAAEDGFNSGNSSTTTETTESIAQNAENTDIQRPQRGERPEGMPQMPQNSEMPEGMPQRPQRGERPEGMPEMPQNGEMPENMPEPPHNGEIPQGGRPQGGGRMGGEGFGMVDEETAAAHAITINGGKIYINANGDGIDSNGNLTITGGEIIIDGPVNNGNGSLDSQGTMSIMGGTVVTASSAGMIQLPRGDGNQNILRVTFNEKQAAETVISIKDSESGEEILSYAPAKEYQALIFSSDKLITDKSYTIYLNGTEYETVITTAGTTNSGSMGNMPGDFGGGFGGGGRRGFDGGMPSRGMINREENRVKVKVNGNDINFDTQPVIKNDTTLVGFRAILEALGATVDWNEETQTVTATKDDTEIILNIGSDIAKVNGKEYTMLLAPEIINNSTMIPVRFVSEQMGMNVGWDDATQLITVNSK